MSRQIPRPLLTALVLPLVVMVGFQSAWAAYACRVDGEVRDRCCCEKKKKKSDERSSDDRPSQLTARSCCDVTIHAAYDAPLTRESDRVSFAYVPVLGRTSVQLIATPRTEHFATIASTARPPPRVPLFLDKHAILR